MACYVYGIVRDDAVPSVAELSGVAHAALDVVHGGAVAAVVAEVSRADLTPPEEADDAAAAWLEDAVRAHEHVLERCLEAGAVLPMRFATTFRAVDDVRALLVERERQFDAELARLLGRREWGLKAQRDEIALRDWARRARPDLVAREHELAHRAEGAAYFERKRIDRELAADGEEAVAACVRAAHARLADAADDARLLPVRPGVCLNGTYLVARADEPEFHRLVGSLQHEHAEVGIRYQASGPWPPYNFVQETDIGDA